MGGIGNEAPLHPQGTNNLGNPEFDKKYSKSKFQ